MHHEAFAILVRSVNLELCTVDALPHGGWSEPDHYAAMLYQVNDMVENGIERSHAFDLLLETKMVIARCKVTGRVHGAWSASGWFLGSSPVSMDRAYELCQGV
jgi:hypothetical protein